MVTTRQQERLSNEKQSNINALQMSSYYRHKRHQRRRTTRHIENENELNALYNADDAQLTGLFSLKDFVGQAVPDVHTLPPMTSECSHCKAFLFPEELH